MGTFLIIAGFFAGAIVLVLLTGNGDYNAPGY